MKNCVICNSAPTIVSSSPEGAELVTCSNSDCWVSQGDLLEEYWNRQGSPEDTKDGLGLFFRGRLAALKQVQLQLNFVSQPEILKSWIDGLVEEAENFV